uniref:Uncharacterized protein n=1 Tax=Marseillevirus LCMAC201 TaxID=2506605 RepID=A0A481YVX5_9VIRU|nr:MAG: hypothetical protein LCMAC201_02580 [Marseillevirus LCMAC201]
MWRDVTDDLAKLKKFEPEYIEINSYFQYEFIISFTLNEAPPGIAGTYQIAIDVNANNIYNFDPSGGWEKWEAVEIRAISQTSWQRNC